MCTSSQLNTAMVTAMQGQMQLQHGTLLPDGFEMVQVHAAR